MRILNWQRRRMEREMASGLPGKGTIISQFTGQLVLLRYYFIGGMSYCAASTNAV